jgi:hypothetical protein
MKTLDDLPNDRCGVACRLLKMIRGRESGCVGSVAYSRALYDLESCGIIHVIGVRDGCTYWKQDIDYRRKRAR